MGLKKFIILIIALCCRLSSWAACPDQIKAFYAAYMGNLLHGEFIENVTLCETYMTPALIQKLRRVACTTGADAVIRAQDVSEDAIRSLSIKSLGDDWYLVRYCWDRDDELTATEIPLKVQEANGTCRIVYITPAWNGTRYGDELLPEAGTGA